MSAGASDAPKVQRPLLSRQRSRSQSSLPCFGLGIRSKLTAVIVLINYVSLFLFGEEASSPKGVTEYL